MGHNTDHSDFGQKLFQTFTKNAHLGLGGFRVEGRVSQALAGAVHHLGQPPPPESSLYVRFFLQGAAAALERFSSLLQRRASTQLSGHPAMLFERHSSPPPSQSHNQPGHNNNHNQPGHNHNHKQPGSTSQATTTDFEQSNKN